MNIFFCSNKSSKIFEYIIRKVKNKSLLFFYFIAQVRKKQLFFLAFKPQLICNGMNSIYYFKLLPIFSVDQKENLIVIINFVHNLQDLIKGMFLKSNLGQVEP
jgi:hypothetical protein